MFNFIKVQNFNKIEVFLLKSLVTLTAVLLPMGLYFALFNSPPDYQQGETVRIMYIHVPSAWMALFAYTFITMCSIGSFIWKNQLSSILAKSAAPIGTAFTLITLITGSLWGRPMWGTYWVWDARLTSVLILLFIYFAYISIWKNIENEERAEKVAAIFAVVGFINIPIIKFSVDWWNTLHQPASITRFEGFAIHNDMLPPLFIMFFAFLSLFFLLLVLNTKTEIITKKLKRKRF